MSKMSKSKKGGLAQFESKQDKYTMDPGRKIYLSNNKTILIKNDFWTTISEKNSGKFFFQKKNFGKKIWEKNL